MEDIISTEEDVLKTEEIERSPTHMLKLLFRSDGEPDVDDGDYADAALRSEEQSEHTFTFISGFLYKRGGLLQNKWFTYFKTLCFKILLSSFDL